MSRRYSSCFSFSPPNIRCKRISENPRTALSGVRRSCDMLGKKSDLFQLPAFGDPASPDQLHGPCDHLGEGSVLRPHVGQQLDFIPGDELQPVKVVPELVELPERCLKRPLVRSQEGGRHTVQLARRIVL